MHNAFPLYVSTCVALSHIHEYTSCHILYMHKASLLYVSSCDTSGHMLVWTSYHNLDIHEVFNVFDSIVHFYI